jgi:hypothetical protein
MTYDETVPGLSHEVARPGAVEGLAAAPGTPVARPGFGGGPRPIRRPWDARSARGLRRKALGRQLGGRGPSGVQGLAPGIVAAIEEAVLLGERVERLTVEADGAGRRLRPTIERRLDAAMARRTEILATLGLGAARRRR